MAAAPRAPKQWQLTKNETITSYESWRQNLVYILSLDKNFVPFLEATWQKQTAANPRRGLTNDGTSVPEAQRLTAAQKNAHLDLLLGQIANFCPVISRNSIVKHSTSLNDIWQKIRQHFGFQSSGAHFLDLASISLQTAERPEDLFQRLMAFFEDNLLAVNGGLTHHGEQVTADEDLSPSLENTIVVLWLQLIHPGLPLLVKQKYGSELRNKTLASLKPEISQALNSLLDELRSIEDTKAMRISNVNPRRTSNGGQGQPRRRPFVSCILCKTAGRPHNTHDLMECRYLPDRDRRPLARSRLINDDPDEFATGDCGPYDECCDHALPPEHSDVPTAPTALRVSIIQSPVLNTFYHEHPVQLTLDTGATSNMVRASAAKLYGLPVTPASQMARQADGVTPMDVVGEVHCTLTRGQQAFKLDALVVRQLDVDFLAGNPFLARNDIGIRPARRQIVIGGSDVIHYGTASKHTTQPAVRRTQSFLLRNPQRTVILPGEYVQLDTPCDSDPDTLWALKPRLDCPSNTPLKAEGAWPPPQQVLSVDHAVRITNTTDSPILLRTGEQLCHVRHVIPVDSIDTTSAPTSTATTAPTCCQPFSTNVILDPDGCLDEDIRDKFRALNLEFDDVFNPTISNITALAVPLKLLSTLVPHSPLSVKADSHSTTEAPLRNCKPNLTSSKWLVCLPDLNR